MGRIRGREEVERGRRAALPFSPLPFKAPPPFPQHPESEEETFLLPVVSTHTVTDQETARRNAEEMAAI